MSILKKCQQNEWFALYRYERPLSSYSAEKLCFSGNEKTIAV
jgi:hypothetical protein